MTIWMVHLIHIRYCFDANPVDRYATVHAFNVFRAFSYTDGVANGVIYRRQKFYVESAVAYNCFVGFASKL